MIVLKVALPVPLRQCFDYLGGDEAPSHRPGMRVMVPFGRRKLVGVIVKVADRSELPREKLARVMAYPDGDKAVLTDELMGLLDWCWHYYKHAPGEVIFNALPPLLRKTTGAIPPLPRQYHVTPAGLERLEQPVGRVKAQMRLLGQISRGASTEAQLRAVSRDWKKLLRVMLEQGWITSATPRPPVLEAVPGPRLLTEQRSAVDAIAAALCAAREGGARVLVLASGLAGLWARENTWYPPESVSTGPDHPRTRWRPPSRSTRSTPGRSSRWYVLASTISGASRSISSTVMRSLRWTCTSAPSSPRYCTRL